jgi:hypothetical protein
MDKNDFVLKVQDLRNLFNTNDWARDIYENDGYRTAVTAWDNNGEYMIDDHITGYYPELETLGIEELAEGDMYTTLQGAPAIVSALRKMGFQAELADDSTYENDPIVPEPSIEDLEQQMMDAISLDTEEGYMEAARLRDRIRRILRDER